MPHVRPAWLICLGALLIAASVASAGSDHISVSITDGRVSVQARNAGLKNLLHEIAYQGDLGLVVIGPLDERISVEFRQLAMPAAIGRLLRGRDYVLQYRKLSFSAQNKLWIFSKTSAGQDVADPLEGLRTALTDDDADTKLAAILELADLGGDQAAAALALALADPDQQIREEAALALGEIGGKTAINSLQLALADEAINVREAAVKAFSDLGDEASVQALAVALHDAEAPLREEAIYALGDLGGERAIALLQQALLDQENTVRETAAEILDELLH